jgi:alpha-tubulin suppressor-like RCC1 family protein
MSLTHSFVVSDTGVLLTCGANDHNELGRSGKRSAFHRVDVLETFRIRDVTSGDGFSVVVLSDGRIMSW